MRQPAPKLSDSFRKNVQEGEGLSGFLRKTDAEILEGVGLSGAGGGWYWENVYRTNVQTAYNAGRALAFDAVNPVALELVGVGDARQTEVCRRLTQPPVRRLYTDAFWKTHWPPFHFGCRTTVRALYDPAELEEDPLTEVPAGEEPAAGFGTNPLSSGNWWRELKSMAARARKYGVQGEIEKAKKILVEKTGSITKSLAGVKKREEMNFNQANEGRPNPGFKLPDARALGYQTNCQTCVVAFEARIRGYNVRAKGNKNNEAIRKLSFQTNLAWIDPRTGKIPEYIFKSDITTAKKAVKWLEDTIQDGHRYTLQFSWKGRGNGGHIVSIFKQKGNIVLYDPQAGKVLFRENLLAYMEQVKYTVTINGIKTNTPPKLLQIDTCDFNFSVVELILEAADE